MHVSGSMHWPLSRCTDLVRSCAASSVCNAPLPLCPLPSTSCRAVQARGAGYAISREDELALVAEVAASTGIILDPV